MTHLTNKQLQEELRQYPDDAQVWHDGIDVIYTTKDGAREVANLEIEIETYDN